MKLQPWPINRHLRKLEMTHRNLRENNTSRRELLVGRRELLQVSVEKGETQVGGEEERSLRGSGVHQGAKASARAQWCRGQCQGTLVTLEC
jgi:hypothetical protein